MMFSRTLRQMLVASAFTAAPFMAQAQVVNEAGDAGQLLPAAQVTSGYVTTINGYFGNLGEASFVPDTDMYRITITNPGAFSVTASTSLAGLDGQSDQFPDDTELFLFDAGGILVGYNDDQVGPYSETPRFNVGDFAGLAAGDYYLAFNLFSYHPTFANGPFGYGPTGGIEGPLTGWAGFTQTRIGNYTLTLTGVGQNVAIDGGVPEPSTWALMILGFGAAGTALRRAQSRRSALRPA